MFTDGTYVICWIRVSSSARCVAGYEAVALWRDPRAWQKPLRPASALRWSTAVARARRRGLCRRW